MPLSPIVALRDAATGVFYTSGPLASSSARPAAALRDVDGREQGLLGHLLEPRLRQILFVT